MTKIVINQCFGGFGLSKRAFEALGLEWDGYGYLKDDWERRDDPALVEVVERLGPAASGPLARLVVVEIPDDVEWEIDDSNGMETIQEKHRAWP
jgi:hypothetical protein